jgi:hypothetical protein
MWPAPAAGGRVLEDFRFAPTVSQRPDNGVAIPLLACTAGLAGFAVSLAERNTQ